MATAVTRGGGGAFLATEAATIAGLSARSGNARRTYADGLCRDLLLERDDSRPVTYRATALGHRIHQALKGVLAGQDVAGDASLAVLEAGGYVDIVADLRSIAARRAIVLRISDAS